MTATYPTYPPVQPPRKNHTKLALAVVIGLAIFVLSVLVIVGVRSSAGNPGMFSIAYRGGYSTTQANMDNEVLLITQEGMSPDTICSGTADNSVSGWSRAVSPSEASTIYAGSKAGCLDALHHNGY